MLIVNIIAMVGSSIWICGSGFGVLGVRHGLADGDAFHAGDGQDVAGPAHRLIHALQAFERVQLGDFRLLQRAVQLDDCHFVAVVAACR